MTVETKDVFWYCEKDCKFRPGGAKYSPIDPHLKEKLEQHRKAGCHDLKLGNPTDSLAHGSKVIDNNDDDKMICVAHQYVTLDKQEQAYHENNNNDCKWECYNPKTHSVDLVKSGIQEEKLHFTSISGDKKISKEVLDYKIKTLRPITYFKSENTKMILVYLPTKKTVEKIRTTKDDEFIVSTDIEWVNSAYFLVSKTDTKGNKTREILPFDAEELKEKYRINVLAEWNDIRWDIHDCKIWVNDTNVISDPKELYDLLDKTVKKYLEYDKNEYTKFNLWGIATYFYDLFTAFPYYDFTGTKRAGKTKSLELYNHICYNSVMSPDFTGSSIFRIIEGLGATVLLDETEEFKNKKNEQAQAVRNLLMQAFLKDQYAIRSDTTKDKNFTPTQYNIYSPKALAHINSFDDVLEDRCLRHTMKRGLNEKIKNTWVSEKDPAFQIIRNKCYRLFLDHADQIYDLQEEARTTLGISGRELQLWTPIMTFALFFEKFGVKGLINDVLASMVKSKEDRQLSDEEESRDLKVLDYLSRFGIKLALNEDVNTHNPTGWIVIGSLYKNFNAIMDEEYQMNPEYFTKRTLSQTLDRLAFTKEKKQDGISFLITETTVNDVKKRMGISEYEDKEHTSHSDKITAFTAFTSDSYLDLPQKIKDKKFRSDKESSDTSDTSDTSDNKIDTSDNSIGIRHRSEVNAVNAVNIQKTTLTIKSKSIKCDKCSSSWITDKPLAEVQKEHSRLNSGHILTLITEDTQPENKDDVV